ncbi:uncharacterized protein MYCFIDRAFT_84724 [Pseudocercospora fijiensis CIRAD86]|uniref:Uncharacterized protein n=1 Tax=Pseudocercospora fijiensis (strain CIRAD86) TaxID=383855 RepID=M2ZD44_PSEFD|nr:uncharacterized protein MYCFIDRAFT_84724 [Pseudocercospora fijiensis CIRAD86]EME77044.1 hypothetical protein MYCFIDRAFT_84724 [Pseudocercospora fijiensis CIRAD86]
MDPSKAHRRPSSSSSSSPRLPALVHPVQDYLGQIRRYLDSATYADQAIVIETSKWYSPAGDEDIEDQLVNVFRTASRILNSSDSQRRAELTFLRDVGFGEEEVEAALAEDRRRRQGADRRRRQGEDKEDGEDTDTVQAQQVAFEDKEDGEDTDTVQAQQVAFEDKEDGEDTDTVQAQQVAFEDKEDGEDTDTVQAQQVAFWGGGFSPSIYSWLDLVRFVLAPANLQIHNSKRPYTAMASFLLSSIDIAQFGFAAYCAWQWHSYVVDSPNTLLITFMIYFAILISTYYANLTSWLYRTTRRLGILSTLAHHLSKAIVLFYLRIGAMMIIPPAPMPRSPKLLSWTFWPGVIRSLFIAWRAWPALKKSFSTSIFRALIAPYVAFGVSLFLLTQYKVNNTWDPSDGRAGVSFQDFVNATADVARQGFWPLELRIRSDWCQIERVAWQIGCAEQRDTPRWLRSGDCTAMFPGLVKRTPLDIQQDLTLTTRCHRLSEMLNAVDGLGDTFWLNNVTEDKIGLRSRFWNVADTLVEFSDIAEKLEQQPGRTDTDLSRYHRLRRFFTRHRIITPEVRQENFTLWFLGAKYWHILFSPIWNRLTTLITTLYLLDPEYDRARQRLDDARIGLDALHHTLERCYPLLRQYGTTLGILLAAYPGVQSDAGVFPSPYESHLSSVYLRSSLIADSTDPSRIRDVGDSVYAWTISMAKSNLGARRSWRKVERWLSTGKEVGRLSESRIDPDAPSEKEAWQKLREVARAAGAVDRK